MKTNFLLEVVVLPSDRRAPSRGGMAAPGAISSQYLTIESWQMLAERLRQEIGEYGQLLALFEEQQRLILRNSPECALEAGQAIADQVRILHQKRQSRERAFAGMALSHAMPANSSLRSLLPFFPAETRPFFQALVTEITVLNHRVRRHSSRNRRLLHSRAVPTG